MSTFAASRMNAPTLDSNDADIEVVPFGITLRERPWIQRQPYLLSRGYQLRPRFHPDWQPSWPPGATVLEIMEKEDSIPMRSHPEIMDATCLRDGSTVLIKRTEKGTPEIEIAQFFSSDLVKDDPANHCVPVLDTFPDPDDDSKIFLVMPLLRHCFSPEFYTVGEFLDFAIQMLEGLAFMHAHNVAHRDGQNWNIMMDAPGLFPEGFHPVSQNRPRDGSLRTARYLTRTEVAVKYYFIDFGISTRFVDEASRTFVVGGAGRERTVPELSDTVPYDPFPVDVFVAGKVLAPYVETKVGLSLLEPLVNSMTQRDPYARPTAQSAFNEIKRLYVLFPDRLRSTRLRSKGQPWFVRAALDGFEYVGRVFGI